MLPINLKTIIIVPTFNEVDNLRPLTLEFAKLPNNFSLLIIDDDSPDGTGQLAEELKKAYEFISVVHNSTKAGLGEAYRLGFRLALEKGAEVVGEMDADLSHDPSKLPVMLDAIINGAEVVIGSRRVPNGKIIGWSWHRQLSSWAATTVARLFLKIKTKDATSGFRLYTKSALKKIPWASVLSSGYAWQEEIIFLAERTKLNCVEVPITFIDRQRGQSKLSFKDITEFFKTLWRLKNL